MRTIQAGSDIVSLFGFSAEAKKSPALSKAHMQSLRGLIVSLASAFLIVLAIAIVLNGTQAALTQQTELNRPVMDGNEAVAYQPGHYISQHVQPGYLVR